MDCVRLRGLKVEAYVGVGAAERARPQSIELDVELWLPLEQAGRTDDLAATIDYGAVVEAVRGVLEGRSFHLLEAVAEHAARAALPFGAREVVVRARKAKPPVKGELAEAEVEVRRSA